MRLFKQRQTEHAFFPATLEVQDTPPAPLGRLLIWLIILFFVLALIWSLLGKVDIVVSAPGKLVTQGHTKVIQPLGTGIVQKIHVVEGQHVTQGEILIELKPARARADLQRINSALKMLGQDKIRLETSLEWFRKDKAQRMPKTLSPIQQRLLFSNWQQYQAKLNTLAQKQAKFQAQHERIAQQVEKYQAILPILNRRTATLKMLSEKQYVQETQYLELEQQRITMRHDLQASEQQAKETQAAIAQVAGEIEQTRKDFKLKILSELHDNQEKFHALSQEKIKAESELDAQTLHAPVSGTIQQLVLHTEGGVVTPAQQLMVIVPDDQRLEVEALVANKDIGFVREGQDTEIKVDAFPFTKYGVIEGKLVNVSDDAIADKNLGLVYKARILMQKIHIRIKGKQVALTPGMTVVAEIKTGQRRLIEYFLAPLLKYRQESIRER